MANSVLYLISLKGRFLEVSASGTIGTILKCIIGLKHNRTFANLVY